MATGFRKFKPYTSESNRVRKIRPALKCRKGGPKDRPSRMQSSEDDFTQ